jgi:regulator of protease activity HflC (stomatin/prohibitin superfamily)
MAGATLAALVVVQQFWQWEIERVEVPAGKYLVQIHRWGKNLGPDDLVAPDDSYKGVIYDVRGEGRYFLNPILWSYEMRDLVAVPPDRCLVLTRKFGKPIPADRIAAGDLLAREGERGILHETLKPGSYRLNPYAYAWKEVEAIDVDKNRVGVRTLKVGRRWDGDAGKEPSRYVMPPGGYRGVQRDSLPPGTYYINPYAEAITAVEVASHIVKLKDIQFPSRDGFILKPFVQVEYQVQPEKAAELLIRLSDDGKLRQDDHTDEEIAKNEILQKIILPHMRGYARIEGSNLDAKDVIVTGAGGPQDEKVANVRERLQRTLLSKVRPLCQEIGIEIRSIVLGDFEPPAELKEQIAARDVARVQQEKNKTLLDQFKTQQELQASIALKDQAAKKVEAETRRVQEQTKARQRLQVEELRLKQELDNARLKLEAAKDRAQAILASGKVEADVIQLQNEAEVAGLKKAIQGFASVPNFAQYQMFKKLAPALGEIFASDDSEFAKLFATYMTPPANVPGKSTPSASATPAKADGP